MKYVIAKYIRLSLDEHKSDSMSIENQRLLADRHIADLDIDGAEVLEFTDNGYSGTNYERPAVQELLSLVSDGAVNCIVVKDFSRFGRNEIETSHFIERVFPLFRVRFISVTDGFDSDEHIGDTGGLEVAFKFLMNAYYSRDLSMKIKSAKHTKMRRGESVGKNCVFGYVKVGKGLEIDENAAETVRRVLTLAAEGKGVTEITRRLNAEKRHTPSEYKKRTENPRCLWESSVVRSLVTNEQYIGTYVSGKTEIIEVGSQRSVQKDENEWIRIPNHHPAIIDAELFAEVQRLFKASAKPYTKQRQTHDYTLKGKVYCGVCGYALNRSNSKNALFSCRHSLVDPDMDCYGLSIRENELEAMVHDMVSDWANRVLRDGMHIAAPLPDVDTQIAALRDEKCRLFERLVSGELDAENHKREKSALDAELERLGAIRDAVSAQSKGAAAHKRLSELAESVLRQDSLTREIANALIERVNVFAGKRIDVTWKTAAFSNNSNNRQED